MVLGAVRVSSRNPRSVLTKFGLCTEAVAHQDGEKCRADRFLTSTD